MSIPKVVIGTPPFVWLADVGRAEARGAENSASDADAQPLNTIKGPSASRLDQLLLA